MDKPDFVEFVLTCGGWQEAQAIADALLEKRLVACVEFIDIKSKYYWHGVLEESKEVKLIMESLADKFEAVEAVVTKIHSYETFVLQQLPITRLSEQAAKWLEAEVTGKDQ
jgi:periplasmic divalent cation tolerance protein